MSGAARRPSAASSSQSSLSVAPSDEEIDMRTRARARRRVIEEDEDDDDDGEEEQEEEEDGSTEEEEAANGSASEDEEEVAATAGLEHDEDENDHEVGGGEEPDEEEEAEAEDEDGEEAEGGEEEEEDDELDSSSSQDEAEELEEGDGDDYKATARSSMKVIPRNTTRRVKAPRKRKAVAELSRSASEDSIQTPSGKSARKITLRISPSKNRAKSKRRGAAAAKEKRPRRSRGMQRDEEEEEEEADDADSWDDFENDQSFASLPKTARQLAKEKANQGADSGSELQELPAEESRKSKLTENEMALRKSEMARRRRNQTEKKLEDDKIETINRLLKKQVSRRSNRDKAAVEDSDADNDEEEATGTSEKRVTDPKQIRLVLKQTPKPFFRYISTKEGSTLSLPLETSREDAVGPYEAKWKTLFHAAVGGQTRV